MSITQFDDPGLLWLLALLAPVVVVYVYRTIKGGAAIEISTISGVGNTQKTYKYWLRHLPFALWCAAFGLLVVALARPQSSESQQKSSTEGIDIVIALDISTSMLSRDFTPDRLGAAKDISSEFIVDRVNDRIGLIVFAGESYTRTPLTTDKRSLLNSLGALSGEGILNDVRRGAFEDGTAIGNGLSTAVNRLKESDAKSKVIILLTDGVNNRGHVAPITAAEIAREFGIKVYTVGVGTKGMAPSLAMDMWGELKFVPAKVEIDEDMLREIASTTGGKYFRATDNQKLSEAYAEINSLEKNKVEIDDFTINHELYQRYALWALALLIVGFAVQRVFLRGIQ